LDLSITGNEPDLVKQIKFICDTKMQVTVKGIELENFVIRTQRQQKVVLTGAPSTAL